MGGAAPVEGIDLNALYEKTGCSDLFGTTLDDDEELWLD